MQHLTAWIRRLSIRKKEATSDAGLVHLGVLRSGLAWPQAISSQHVLRLITRLGWLGVVLYAAIIVWRIWQPLAIETAKTMPFAASTVNPGAVPALTEADLGVIFQQQWFGSLARKPVAKAVAPAPTAVTKLNFILRGVAPASDPARSVAVIETQGQQESYIPGEKIAGSAVRLLKVEATQVWLDNAGVTERLVLPGESSGNSSPVNSAPVNSALNKPSATRVSVAKSEALSALRDEIAREPQKIFRYIRLSPVRKDKALVGYRVSPGVNRLLFEQAGLQDKDIAVALNGLDLTNDQQAQKALRELADLPSITLTVVRDKIRYDILISP